MLEVMFDFRLSETHHLGPIFMIVDFALLVNVGTAMKLV
jgi:hypothetical protein